MAQVNKKGFDEVRIPFQKMTFAPDVPSTSLGPNEYNSGLNVETDVRGIRSASGDEIILPNIPGRPTFVTGGYRRPIPGSTNDFWYIVATDDTHWYACNGEGDWIDITPAGLIGPYTQSQNISESWNGTVPFFNDEANPPMFWPEFTGQGEQITSANSAAGTTTLNFSPNTANIESVNILDHEGTFTYTSSYVPLRVGQKVRISGTNTNTTNPVLNTVKIVGNAGEFTAKSLTAPASFVGSISGTTLTVTSVSSGVIYGGMELDGAGITAGTIITAYVSGSPTGASVWTVDTSQTAGATNITGQRTLGLTPGQTVRVTGTNTSASQTLSTVKVAGTAGEFSCAAATLSVGQSVTVSGTITNTPQTLSTVSIIGDAGEFSCASATLVAGQTITISGTITNTPTTLSGVAITGTAGEFSCSATSLQVGQTVTISGVYGGTGSIAGYVPPTTYYISATNGSTTFTLSELTGAALVTTAGTPTGLTYTVNIPSITGYDNPTDYLISATDGSSTFTIVNLDGSKVATTGGTPTGLTYTVQVPAITNYSNPTTYVISATNGTTSFTLVEVIDNVAYALETKGGEPTGLTFTVEAADITGYSNPTDYYISTTNGTTTFTLVDANGDAITTQGGTPTGLSFRVLAPSITGYSDPTDYYVIATNETNKFQLSTTPSGSAIATNAGTLDGLTFLNTQFGVGQEILVQGVVPVGFRGIHTVTAVDFGSVSYAGTTAGPLTQLGCVSDVPPPLTLYSNQLPLDIDDIAYLSPGLQRLTFKTAQTSAPFAVGSQIVISNVSTYFNGTFLVAACTTDTVDYYAIPGAAYQYSSGQTVAPKYSWNYNPNWASVKAKFMRLYSTPNVGNILVAGGLTAIDLTGTELEFPVTVQWSQAFGLNEAPLTWEPTVTNVANQLEVPLRGAVVDAFPCNGQLFLQSVWDTVVFSPLNYSTTSAPILGVRLANQGRGMLSSNCWANTDKLVYGIDARDIWVFNGQDFQGLGNQRVKNWFFDQLDPDYIDRIFMQTNTQKNQVEIFYPTKPPVISNIQATTDGWFNAQLEEGYGAGPMRNNLEVYLTGTETGTGSISGYNPAGSTYYVVNSYTTSANIVAFQLSTTPTGYGVTTTAGTVTGVDFKFISDGVPNMMLSYRYDLDCFNAPREVQAATFATESPSWSSQEWYFNLTGTNISSSGTGAHFNILRTNSAYKAFPTPNVRGTGYAVGDTILVAGNLLGGETPANDATLTVATVDSGGRIATLTATGSVLDTWRYNEGHRSVVYARGLENRTLVQKDEGYNFLGPQLLEYPIQSSFRRDNIKMLQDYSGKLLVHRILPEIINLTQAGVPVNPATTPSSTLLGSVDIQIEGANSVGQSPQDTTALTLDTNTDYPWVQISQNAHRVNSIILSNSSNENIWMCSATTWQFTQTEDDR